MVKKRKRSVTLTVKIDRIIKKKENINIINSYIKLSIMAFKKGLHKDYAIWKDIFEGKTIFTIGARSNTYAARKHILGKADQYVYHPSYPAKNAELEKYYAKDMRMVLRNSIENEWRKELKHINGHGTTRFTQPTEVMLIRWTEKAIQDTIVWASPCQGEDNDPWISNWKTNVVGRVMKPKTKTKNIKPTIKNLVKSDDESDKPNNNEPTGAELIKFLAKLGLHNFSVSNFTTETVAKIVDLQEEIDIDVNGKNIPVSKIKNRESRRKAISNKASKHPKPSKQKENLSLIQEATSGSLFSSNDIEEPVL